MTDTTTATRDAGRALLPELEASNAELNALLQSLLSPSAVAALGANPGSVAITAAAPVGDVPARATTLLRDLDSLLPALRAAESTGTVK